jgi:hypothetical protein
MSLPRTLPLRITWRLRRGSSATRGATLLPTRWNPSFSFLRGGKTRRAPCFGWTCLSTRSMRMQGRACSAAALSVRAADDCHQASFQLLVCFVLQPHLESNFALRCWCRVCVSFICEAMHPPLVPPERLHLPTTSRGLGVKLLRTSGTAALPSHVFPAGATLVKRASRASESLLSCIHMYFSLNFHRANESRMVMRAHTL